MSRRSFQGSGRGKRRGPLPSHGGHADPTYAAVKESVDGIKDYQGVPIPDERRVYFVRAVGGGAVKIGRSRNIDRRITELQDACPHKLELVGSIDGDETVESLMHERFQAHRIRGEWYDERILGDVLNILSV
ncbi:MAG: GIY-YIG nuclease family protein [Betaproteobacteria bacterium]|nr:GIY-YIG nuclease family protein [Betaproteobacteria bacterium]